MAFIVFMVHVICVMYTVNVMQYLFYIFFMKINSYELVFVQAKGTDWIKDMRKYVTILLYYWINHPCVV